MVKSINYPASADFIFLFYSFPELQYEIHTDLVHVNSRLVRREFTFPAKTLLMLLLQNTWCGDIKS